MKTLNFLCANLFRYIFDFLDYKERFLIGIINKRHRKILNLKREFLKLFFFALKIDYKNKLFMNNTDEHINILRKKFPYLEEELIVDFVAFYIRCSNERNRSIVFSTKRKNNQWNKSCEKFLIYDSLNSKLFRDFAHDKEIIFQGNKHDANKLEKLAYNFNNYPLKYIDVSNYPVLEDVCFMTTEKIIQYINFSEMNPHYFKEIKCTYEDGVDKNILRKFLHYNQNAIKILYIWDMNYELDWLSINKFHKLYLFVNEIKQENFENFTNFIMKIKNFTREIYLECDIYTNEISKKFSELISANLTNLVSLKVITNKDCMLDLELITKTNNILRIVDLSDRWEDYDEDEDENNDYDEEYFLVRIRPNVILFNAQCSESFLNAAKSIIEKNLGYNDVYFRKFCLKGNAKYLIDFFNFMAEHMSNENFKNCFSKISKFVIYQRDAMSDFIFSSSTKDNINKCFLHMKNLITLKIDFNKELIKFLPLFQFELLKSLKGFTYEILNKKAIAHLDVLKQLKDIKLIYLNCEIYYPIKEFEDMAKYQEHLVKLKVKNGEKKMKGNLNIQSFFEFVARRKSLNTISLPFEFKSITKELNEKYEHLTIFIK